MVQYVSVRSTPCSRWFDADMLRRLDVSVRLSLGSIPSGGHDVCGSITSRIYLLVFHDCHDARLSALHNHCVIQANPLYTERVR